MPVKNLTGYLNGLVHSTTLGTNEPFRSCAEVGNFRPSYVIDKTSGP